MSRVGPIYFPVLPWDAIAATSLSTRTLNANTNSLAHIFECPAADTITHIGFRQSSITIPTGPCVMRVGLQGVNSSGVEDGTWLASGNGYADYSSWSSGNDGTYIWVALGTSVTVTMGQMVAIVLDPQSGFDASNFVVLATNIGSVLLGARLPYMTVNGTKSTNVQIMTIAARSSTATYGPVIEAFTNATFNSSSNPDEVALKFLLPSGSCSTFKVDGIGFSSASSSTGRSYRVRLYDSDGSTVLASKDYDTTKTVNQAGLFFAQFDSELTLNANTSYRASLTSLSASAPITPYYTNFPASGDISGVVYGGTVGWSERADVGSWTDNAARLPQIFVRITDLTGGSGGSGPLVGPGRLVR